MTVNKERVRLLVEALRSGQYNQTRGFLCRIDPVTYERKYCCLGVATVVAQENGVQLTETTTEGGVIQFDGAAACLPFVVMDWYGLDLPNPILNDGSTFNPPATVLNDIREFTFPEIADAFEKAYLR